MNVQLTEKHIKKLSVITELPLEEVARLSSMGLLDSNRAVELLIKYDWRLLSKNKGEYTVQARINAIMSEYGVAENRVRQAIYGKRSMEYYCSECGRVITKTEHARNNGMCDKCVVKKLTAAL